MSLSNINPVKRLEYFLQDIADGKTTATKTPVRRIEEFLRRIAIKAGSSGGGAGGAGLSASVGTTLLEITLICDDTIAASDAGVIRLAAAGFNYSQISELGIESATTLVKNRLLVTLNGETLAIQDLDIRDDYRDDVEMGLISISFLPSFLNGNFTDNRYLHLWEDGVIEIHGEEIYTTIPRNPEEIPLTIHFI